MEGVDVLVVGAGPAGSTLAGELARRGHSVRIVEEHPDVGHPVQCAGLVSDRVLELAGHPNVVRRPVRGATVFGPSLGRVHFNAPVPKAYVIDRAGLDIALADRATRAGATLTSGVKFDGLARSSNGLPIARLVRGTGAPEEVEARLIVGADGVASAVARAFRIRRPVEILPAYEVEFSESPGDPDQVEVYLGNSISPGLVGWWIPDGAGGARVGVAVSAGPTTAKSYCDRLVALLARRFGAPLRGPTKVLVSGIPIGLLARTVGDRVLLVGDAAAQVKPLSGGGIFTGMRCAGLAAETIDAALRSNDLSAGALGAYERAWREELGPEFERALYLRRVMVRLKDPDLDRIITALDAAELKGAIVAFGDIDFPSRLARQLFLRSPSLVRYFPQALGALWGSSAAVAPDLEPGPRRK
ncbi:MAG: NAD(P)/FAD-dependent oxidoreductase [Thermoplasmata archaeon]|nr:NAD(P)/FAD-dependent oxidoreductase [Thermoplasmata archaeon]